MKTLYVTDLDGTLLNSKHRISTYSREKLDELMNEGLLFTFATARSLVSARQVIGDFTPKVPVVVYNGSYIMDAATEEIIDSVHFTTEEIRDVVEVLKRKQINPLVYAFIEGVEKVSWMADAVNEGMQYYLDNRKGDRRFRPLQDEKQLYEGEIFYFTCIGEKEELLPIYEHFSKDERYRCTLQQELYREEYWCEIMPRKATKAEAIKKLKEMIGCDRLISFGDAINDLPMFEISDECYAVRNAVEALKEKATDTIASNDEDGVVNCILAHVNE